MTPWLGWSRRADQQRLAERVPDRRSLSRRSGAAAKADSRKLDPFAHPPPPSIPRAVLFLHVCRMRLSDKGARTLAISGRSTGDSIQTASAVGISASDTPAARSIVSHAVPNAAETRTTPHAGAQRQQSLRERPPGEVGRREHNRWCVDVSRVGPKSNPLPRCPASASRTSTRPTTPCTAHRRDVQATRIPCRERQDRCDRGHHDERP